MSPSIDIGDEMLWACRRCHVVIISKDEPSAPCPVCENPPGADPQGYAFIGHAVYWT